MCKLTKEEEYSIISRTMTNIRSLRTYVRELDFEQLLDMQEKLNTVIEDAVKMLNEKRLNVRNWKLNVNRYLSTSFLWGLTRKNGRVSFCYCRDNGNQTKTQRRCEKSEIYL